MAISKAIARAQLKTLAEDAETQFVTLAYALKTFRRARVNDTKAGRFLVSTSGDGVSTSFQIVNGITPINQLEAADDLEERHISARARLVAAGTASPTDAQILDDMLLYLVPLRFSTPDFAGIR